MGVTHQNDAITHGPAAIGGANAMISGSPFLVACERRDGVVAQP
jgi:hypothetical protein